MLWKAALTALLATFGSVFLTITISATTYSLVLLIVAAAFFIFRGLSNIVLDFIGDIAREIYS